ncbi:MAG TPA: AAA family ATPase [Syntrophorhabdaceae bacterium]|nr:AAA family ATPase [Syntrophorhabdaceae bacterium]
MEIPYLEYFGLTEKPFGLTPDAHFYYESQTHREAIEHLRFFLAQKEGFACIYGDVGTGKTVLSRLFLDGLDKNIYNSALILNPIMGEQEFLQAVLTELGIQYDNTLSKKDLFSKLEEFLISEHKKGKETIIIIDEAQLITNETFDFIRILSNIETDKEKILHIIFFGQHELIERLKQPHMRYLAQRISIIYRLKTLNINEVNHYITHRLLKAGSKGFVQFEEKGLEHIYKASKGYPRVINIICDRCLLFLYSRSASLVDEKVVKSVLEDESISTLVEIEKEKENFQKRIYKWLPYLVATSVVLILIILAIFNIIPVHELFKNLKK